MDRRSPAATVTVSVNEPDSNESNTSSSSSCPSYVDDLVRRSNNGIEIGYSDGVDPRPGTESESLIKTGLINTKIVTKPHLPLCRKLAYGVGHVFNDMCASMWFTYLLVFFHFVVRLNNTYAGLLLLIGQIVDASATPVIGILCDKTRTRYGRRKIWHLVGTIMVAISLFFFWHTCLPCNHSTPLGLKIFYFAVPISIFQFGWASVQISHLSLIPELTEDESERVGLNAIRYDYSPVYSHTDIHTHTVD